MNQTLNYELPEIWEYQPDNKGEWSSINRPTAGSRFDKALPRGNHPFQLYSLATPNGQKVTILFEELLEKNIKEAEYDAFLIRISECEQFSSGFVDINPNSKIPALFDNSNNCRVFESGAILLYLADKFNQFIPSQHALRTETLNWLFWLQGSAPFLGGGFGHFFKYAPMHLQYPIDRFAMEAKRQLDVLNQELATKEYLNGDSYSIADIATWPWYGRLVQDEVYPDAGKFLQVQQYEHVQRWAEQIANRPAVQRGIRVNRSWGDEALQLAERHSAEDFLK